MSTVPQTGQTDAIYYLGICHASSHHISCLHSKHYLQAQTTNIGYSDFLNLFTPKHPRKSYLQHYHSFPFSEFSFFILDLQNWDWKLYKNWNPGGARIGSKEIFTLSRIWKWENRQTETHTDLCWPFLDGVNPQTKQFMWRCFELLSLSGSSQVIEDELNCLSCIVQQLSAPSDDPQARSREEQSWWLSIFWTFNPREILKIFFCTSLQSWRYVISVADDWESENLGSTLLYLEMVIGWQTDDEGEQDRGVLESSHQYKPAASCLQISSKACSQAAVELKLLYSSYTPPPWSLSKLSNKIFKVR